MRQQPSSVHDLPADRPSADRVGDRGSAPESGARSQEYQPDWVAAREAVDEMIADVGEIPETARAWARLTLGLDEQPS